jgi:hypothetical protein
MQFLKLNHIKADIFVEGKVVQFNKVCIVMPL